MKQSRELNEGLSFRNETTVLRRAENAITAHDAAFRVFRCSSPAAGATPLEEMITSVTNVIQFPLDRARSIQGCPHCGKRTSVWRIGRLAWAYCDVHAVRWVAADLKTIAHGKLDRQQLRKGLEFLSAFVEVSR